MKIETESTESGLLYAKAYAAHYVGRDLTLAFQHYRTLLSSFPTDLEAAYAQKQVQNILAAVVPKQELLEAQLALVHFHLEYDERTEPERQPLNPRSSELRIPVGARTEQRLENVNDRSTIVSAS